MSEELTDQQMESIIEGGEENQEIPMTNPDPVEVPDDTQQTAEAQENAEMLTIDVGGKKIQATQEQINSWASQGYQGAQQADQFKQQQTEFQQKQSEFDQNYKYYQQIEEYAQQNPDWWANVQENFENREQITEDPTNPLVQQFNQLQEKINEQDQFIQSLKEERNTQEHQKQDQALEQEIQSIRDEYKDLAWNVADKNGLTLEQQVLMHAQNNGINNYRAAFRDYAHDKLVALAQERAKENIGQEIQKSTKLGQLNAQPEVQTGFKTPRNIKELSYDDLLQEALAEIESQNAS